MPEQILIVDAVICGQLGQVAVHVLVPAGIDLQFIYRAALGVYWNAAEALLEARSNAVESTASAAARMAHALREEYGMVLQPSDDVRWSGFSGGGQADVETALFGRAGVTKERP
jgi:hypothetical protein